MTVPQKLLIIEDDPSILRLLEIIFQNVNIQVYTSSIGKTVCGMIQDIHPDMIILDIGLPDINGIDLLKLIREKYEIPIIMLSALNTDLEKITCLSLGADDYVVKPFSSGELIARLQAIYRRSQHIPEEKQKDKSIALRIEVEENRAYFGKEELSLSKKEFQLLHFLLEMEEKVLTRDLILDQIWGLSNLKIESRAVDALVSRLRKKLKTVVGVDIIEAIPGSGYRLSIKNIQH